MKTQQQPTVVILTNGQMYAVRNRVVRGGLLLGYATWTGRFINIANVAEAD